MSVDYTALEGYVLLLSEHTVNEIFYNIRGEKAEDIWDALEVVDAEYQQDFEGTAYPIQRDGRLGQNYENSDIRRYYGDEIFFIPIEREVNLFAPTYSSMDELVEEFKKRTKGHLPKDFNIREHLYYITGTYMW